MKTLKKLAFASVALALALSIVSCKKPKEEETDYEKTCKICGRVFGSAEECAEHEGACNFYDDSQFAPADDYHYMHWMRELPDTTKITNLTIPGMHDAATYCFNSSITPTWIKDQVRHYSEAWDEGVRAYDLRLGFDGRIGQGGFDDCCKFFHGDNGFGYTVGLCEMRNFYIEIEDRFPSVDQLDGECMFLIVKEECVRDNRWHLNVFECLCRYLIKKYTADRFIAYSPDLTLKDIRGKIIMFVRTKTYTEDYYGINNTSGIYVNYLTGFPDTEGFVNIETYKSGSGPYNTYEAFVQDHYDIGSSGVPHDKYEAFGDAIWHEREYRNNHKVFLAFNGMNGVQSRASWDVCEYMNLTVYSNLVDGVLTFPYKQPLGIVLGDMMCVGDYKYGFWWTTRHFRGDVLVRALVDHNTRWYNH